MKLRSVFLGLFATAMLGLPALAADDAVAITGTRWGRNSFDFEPMPSGPQPLRNVKRRPDGTSGNQLVGDYNNPILKPDAAVIVKQRGELALAGKGFPNLSDQCRLYSPPFTFAMQLNFLMVQKSDGDLAILYNQDDNVRHVRMNGTHLSNVVPSPMGDSVGHWEGDTLVIDTVGIKTNAFTATDRLGTPQSDAMHVIERYRLIDGTAAKEAQDKYEKAEGIVAGNRFSGQDPNIKTKGLQLELMMEDPNVFTAPLTVLVTYRHTFRQWEEQVCAENPIEYYKDEWIGLPKADQPDF